MSQGDFFNAVRKAAIDGINSAAVSGNLNQGTLSGYMQVVNGHAMNGRITQTEAGQINNDLYNLYLGWKGRGMAQ